MIMIDTNVAIIEISDNTFILSYYTLQLYPPLPVLLYCYPKEN